jgi:hypothetical protein
MDRNQVDLMRKSSEKKKSVNKVVDENLNALINNKVPAGKKQGRNHQKLL